jgi:hypothetical protein
LAAASSVLVCIFVLRWRYGVLVGKIDSALAVDFCNLNSNLITHFNHIFYLVNPVVSQFGDVNQAFLAGKNFNKRTKIHYSYNFTGIDVPCLNFFGNSLYDSQGFFYRQGYRDTSRITRIETLIYDKPKPPEKAL